jgi:uncharacterized protein HemY
MSFQEEINIAEIALAEGRIDAAKETIIAMGKRESRPTEAEARAAVGLIQIIMAVELFLYSEMQAPEETGDWIMKLKERRVSDQLAISARIDSIMGRPRERDLSLNGDRNGDRACEAALG